MTTSIRRKPVEEENTPYYDPRLFYPARVGDVLSDRYQLAAKLGYGSSSTVWLARDLDRLRYVAIKINAGLSRGRETVDVDGEIDTLRLIAETNPRHGGYAFVRRLLDSFPLEYGSQTCLALVFEPLREPLWLYRRRFGLDYLHSECHVIHTDLKPDNIMVKLEDLSLLEESAKDEYENPLPRKMNAHGHTIYLSRNDYGLPRKTTGITQITDFDRSVSGTRSNDGCIQAEIYRAPEVILDAGFSYSADIWNLGVMLWDVLEGNPLFRNIDPLRVHAYDEVGHLARITALLGPPPRELLGKGKRTLRFYNGGILNGPTVEKANFNFEMLLERVRGEDKRMFIQFVRRMLKWCPEERSTAGELLQDPWLFC
ncbi:protein kinase-like protein [Aspergillus taichungensis]|uniref:non-specific serine/threonine protein kinase n=1 Tax=Aspergillus taichungensis TaxID=482145 RepID=A0A2J5HRJ6_9EURO|nr:protein kinase-like protein [Aspergillus taichungensis]